MCVKKTAEWGEYDKSEAMITELTATEPTSDASMEDHRIDGLVIQNCEEKMIIGEGTAHRVFWDEKPS